MQRPRKDKPRDVCNGSAQQQACVEPAWSWLVQSQRNGNTPGGRCAGRRIVSEYMKRHPSVPHLNVLACNSSTVLRPFPGSFHFSRAYFSTQDSNLTHCHFCLLPPQPPVFLGTLQGPPGSASERLDVSNPGKTNAGMGQDRSICRLFQSQ